MPAQQQAKNVRREHFGLLLCYDEPARCFNVRAKVQLGKAHPQHPAVSMDIARRKTKCFVDMWRNFRRAAAKILRSADRRVRRRRDTDGHRPQLQRKPLDHQPLAIDRMTGA
jgi:hypothetical protein